MGLDISVYAPGKIPENPSMNDNFISLPDCPELVGLFPDNEYEMPVEYIDFDESCASLGLDPASCEIGCVEYGPVIILTIRHAGEEHCVVDPPFRVTVERCLSLNEVGYQRKGANKRFYEDDVWNSPCVTDMKTLNLHWEKYFSAPTPDSKGGWGSGVEYDKSAEEMRSDFGRNIVEKFKEGETFVMYH
jgi:hypothetical protein